MTVYVDDMSNYQLGQLRRMKMSHMIADTEDELHEMAERIGVRRHWYQGDHYDICLTAKKTAFKLGAKLITMKQCAALRFLKRYEGKLGDPATAIERMYDLKYRLRGSVIPYGNNFMNSA